MFTAKFNVHIFYVVRTHCIYVFWVDRPVKTNFFYSYVVNIFLQVFALCLLLNKLRLFVLTQHNVILISVFIFSSQIVPLAQFE